MARQNQFTPHSKLVLCMKYWTIVFPGEFDQHVQETWSEDQIIKAYHKNWCDIMIVSNKHDKISKEVFIDDWCVIHWAEETDEFGKRIKNNE